MEFTSIEAIKKCIANGFGITIMPRMSVKKELEQKSLAVLPWTEDNLETAILMIWHKDKWISPTLKAFMDMMRNRINTNESGA